MLNVVPRESGKPVVYRPVANVGSEHEAVPIDHRIDRYRGAEARSAPDHPAGQYSAAAATRDVQPIRVHIPFCHYRINARIQIKEIVAGIGMVNQVAELAAITGRAARVSVEHNVTARRHELFL